MVLLPGGWGEGLAGGVQASPTHTRAASPLPSSLSHVAATAAQRLRPEALAPPGAPSLSAHPMHPVNQQLPREVRSWLFLAMPQPRLSPGCSLTVALPLPPGHLRHSSETCPASILAPETLAHPSRALRSQLCPTEPSGQRGVSVCALSSTVATSTRGY